MVRGTTAFSAVVSSGDVSVRSHHHGKSSSSQQRSELEMNYEEDPLTGYLDGPLTPGGGRRTVSSLTGDEEKSDTKEDDDTDLETELNKSTDLTSSNVLACLFLVDPGNRATVRLLMRGMPIPCTYGFPGTDGKLWSNAVAFVKNFHPSISIKYAHQLHPFTRKERLVIFLCTVAFNALWSAFTAYQKGTIKKSISTSDRRLKEVIFLLVKHVATVVYAVVIRQLVICPCAYNALVEAITTADDPDLEDLDLHARAKRLMKMKIMGDRVLLWLLAAHVAATVGVVAWIGTWDLETKSEQTVESNYYHSPRTALIYIAISEAINFLFWFVKCLPLFLILYPIHRASWYQGGDVKDYVLCRKSCSSYVKSSNYLNPNFPRSVEPETRKCLSAKMKTLVTDVFRAHRSRHGYHLSTFRRDSEFHHRVGSSLSGVPPSQSRRSASTPTFPSESSSPSSSASQQQQQRRRSSTPGPPPSLLTRSASLVRLRQPGNDHHTENPDPLAGDSTTLEEPLGGRLSSSSSSCSSGDKTPRRFYKNFLGGSLRRCLLDDDPSKSSDDDLGSPVHGIGPAGTTNNGGATSRQHHPHPHHSSPHPPRLLVNDANDPLDDSHSDDGLEQRSRHPRLLDLGLV